MAEQQQGAVVTAAPKARVSLDVMAVGLALLAAALVRLGLIHGVRW